MGPAEQRVDGMEGRQRAEKEARRPTSAFLSICEGGRKQQTWKSQKRGRAGAACEFLQYCVGISELPLFAEGENECEYNY